MEFTIQTAFVREKKIKDGTRWQGVIEYTVPGSDKHKRFTEVFPATVKDKEQAQRRLKRLRDRAAKELTEKKEPRPIKLDASMDVAEYVVQATRRRIITNKIEPSTAYGYRFSLAHISDGFAGVHLCDLKPNDVRDWIAGMVEAGLSPATVSKALRLLKAALDEAEEDGIIPSNPCRKRTVRAPKLRKEEPNYLDERGRAALSALLSGIESTPLGIAANLARFTGMRRGEICALRWCDVDLDAATVHVNQAIGIRQGGAYVKAPKSEKGARAIPIPNAFVPILAAYRDAMHEEWASIARKSNGELNEREFQSLFVVGSLDGRFANPSKLGKKWQALAEAFDLKGSEGEIVGLHDLRRTYSTVANNDPTTSLKATSANMGHTREEFTSERYTGVEEAAKRRTAEAVARAYGF